MCKVTDAGERGGTVQGAWIGDVKRGVSRGRRQVAVRYEGLC